MHCFSVVYNQAIASVGVQQTINNINTLGVVLAKRDHLEQKIICCFDQDKALILSFKCNLRGFNMTSNTVEVLKLYTSEWSCRFTFLWVILRINFSQPVNRF